MSAACPEERFLRDVAKHEMIVIRDDGVHRHIRFKQPDSSNMFFDLVTWPGFLCYSGDMGTYVFQRTQDMFGFFRKNGRLDGIDRRYWAEKIEAADNTGVTRHSHDEFTRQINDWVDQQAEGDKPGDDEPEQLALWAEAYAELRAEVESEVLSADSNEVRCFDAANDFTHAGDAWKAFHGLDTKFEFTDFWEVDTKEYTPRFLWCCYALAWGIEQYDAAQRLAAEAVPA
ncbi:hypothetical protein [Janthinobacterium lividum]|uniref:hypothetical protein n=1 Tax=Janthinobacterium lividum TaxID=29581 RepID=UPI00140B0FDA|nr:hypothetical protein [Janthinobacterium lividum]NHQ93355.1 hypothetical protein [Janthinobacterium lividum]